MRLWFLLLAFLAGCVAEGDTGPVLCRHAETHETLTYQIGVDELEIHLINPPYLLVNGRKVTEREWVCEQLSETGQTRKVKTCNSWGCWKPMF